MTPADKLVMAEARSRFASLVMRLDQEIDLAEAALLVAAEDAPHCNVAHSRALLEEFGAEARARIAHQPGGAISVFNQYIFEELGFVGNQTAYYDPRNSLLNYVLERRIGIPITLSVVYMEVGRRAGLRVDGVALPGHFIVRVHSLGDSDAATLVDPFRGKVIDEEDCQERLDVVYNGQVPLDREHLQTATSREIMVRLLRNLKAIYVQAQLHRRALATVERILLLGPHLLDERRDRGALLAQLNRLHEAIADTQTYLKFAPGAPDADTVREGLKNMRIRLAMLN